MTRKCGQCGSRNDPKRVICQNCGARLPEPDQDGGELVAPPAAHQPPPPVFKGGKTKHATLKTVRPRHTVRNILLLIAVAILAAMAWAGSKALEPVGGLMSPVVPKASTVAHVRESLANAAAFGQGSWVGEVGVVNQVLAATATEHQIVDKGGMRLRFQRCYMEFAAGTADLIMVLEVNGRELVCRLSMEPVAWSKGSGVRFLKASIGGLHVPPIVADLAAPLWAPCIERSRSLVQEVATAKQIEITPKAVILKWAKSSP